MGRGQNKKLSAKEILFKPIGQKSDSEKLEEKKFAEARKRIQAEVPPTETDEEGNKYWRNEAGDLHRDGDLPAIITSDGEKNWCQNGLLHREGDKPSAIMSNGDKRWHKHGKFHRENDKPAVKKMDGTREWWQNGKRHRDSGPAVIHPDGSEEIWKEGERITSASPEDP